VRGHQRVALLAVLDLGLDEGIDLLDVFLKIFVEIVEARCAADVGEVDFDAGDGLGGRGGGGLAKGEAAGAGGRGGAEEGGGLLLGLLGLGCAAAAEEQLVYVWKLEGTIVQK
jgi:hypothetical protein